MIKFFKWLYATYKYNTIRYAIDETNRIDRRIDLVEIESIKKFKGLCFYLQIDVALDFVFFPERFSKEYVRTFLHRADYKDLFQDKRWVILSPAKKFRNSVSIVIHYEQVTMNYIKKV